jgi:acyl carrier protein
MSELMPLEREVAELVVGSLNLEDIRAEEINPEAPLFGEGLGLDSIDALELALAIGQKYGVRIQADDVENERIFASLRALARHIEQRRAAA